MKSYKKRMGIVFFLLAILTGCGTSPGIGENTLQSKGPGGFPSVVQQVMMSLKAHTTIPLFAPTFVPTGRGYLTATIQPGGCVSKKLPRQYVCDKISGRRECAIACQWQYYIPRDSLFWCFAMAIFGTSNKGNLCLERG